MQQQKKQKQKKKEKEKKEENYLLCFQTLLVGKLETSTLLDKVTLVIKDCRIFQCCEASNWLENFIRPFLFSFFF